MRAIARALALAIPALAAAQPWSPAGFGGAGNFLGVTVDPSQPGVIYAASDVSGLYRSSTYGDSFTLRSVGLGNAEISSLAIDPFNASRLFAGAGAFAAGRHAGMYSSTDSGQTWRQLPASAAAGIHYRRWSTASSIACDPSRRTCSSPEVTLRESSAPRTRARASLRSSRLP